jgi:hypothetical protein
VKNLEWRFFMKKGRRYIFLYLFVALCAVQCSAQFTLVEDEEKGLLTIRDGSTLVLSYCFGDQLPGGIDSEQIRSGYIHPLYDLDGATLTADFPNDHLHHHGLFWTWPVVRTRGQGTQTWHPATPSLRQHFVRWLKRETADDQAVLCAENVWKLAEEEIVAAETVTLRLLPANEIGRVLDVEIKLRAVGGPLTLAGSPDQEKGYGGLCLRGVDLFKGAALTTDRGVLEKDSTDVPFRWADVSTPQVGISIFVSPTHPAYPPTWLIRNSYAGILNVSWPGLKSATLEANETVTLVYRIYIHRGDVSKGRVKKAYQRYISEFK